MGALSVVNDPYTKAPISYQIVNLAGIVMGAGGAALGIIYETS